MALVILACAGAAPAPQPAEDELTVLYQRAGEPYTVVLLKDRVGELCNVVMNDQGANLTAVLGLDGSGRNLIEVSDMRPGTKLYTGAVGSTVPLALEIAGLRQIYNLKVTRTGSVEALVARAAQAHLRQAIQATSGFALILRDRGSVQFTVPRPAATAFDECVESSIRGRLDEQLRNLQRFTRP